MNGKTIGTCLVVGAAAFSGGVALGHQLAQKRVQRTIDSQLNKIWHDNMAKPIGKITRLGQTDEGLNIEAEMDPTHPFTKTLVRDIREASEPTKYSISSAELVSWGPTTQRDAPGYIVSVNPIEHSENAELADRDPQLAELLEEEKYTSPTTKSVFEEDDGDWNYQFELNAREGQDIYVIHRDEFFADEMEYTQGQLTYYKGDDMLTDELGKPIVPYRKWVGATLNRFGHGSKDPNVVFVRNDKEKMEWEIALDLGYYAVEVLGNDVEDVYQEQDLKHSAVPRFYKDE